MNETETIIDLVSNLKIGSCAHAGRLTLIQVLAPIEPPSTASPTYLLYELQVTNRGNQPVLLVEGEVLLGMKQTRVLNVTILVPAQTVLQVPVSCVESGRWQAVSSEAMGKAAIHLAPSVRAAKTVTVARSMRAARTFASDQAEVWAGVDRVLDGNGADAPSRSYADLAVSGAPAHGDSIARNIETAPGQVGVLLLVDRQVSCVDVFESSEVLGALWSGLLASYEAEGLATRDRKGPAAGARAESAAWHWFKSIAKGSIGVGPEIGLGAHVTVVAPGLEAAALVNHGRVVHLSAFPAHTAPSSTRFVRPTQRRS
jgi:hypothetical protein